MGVRHLIYVSDGAPDCCRQAAPAGRRCGPDLRGMVLEAFHPMEITKRYPLVVLLFSAFSHPRFRVRLRFSSLASPSILFLLLAFTLATPLLLAFALASRLPAFQIRHPNPRQRTGLPSVGRRPRGTVWQALEEQSEAES
ncbi:hypothetical protein NDU88_004059 [Pleurodeles waltl]|uniref:Uncharacterized protein n=1 Tax=Pleurodeles waltl TaxID=8319 RepID=A0AAV7M5W1_PLEWA|nr:hypothetical protein NDU88_004059 [Pleurodeles waltl]